MEDVFELTDKHWVSVKDNPPEEGIEFLLYNEKWIDEDFNPKGIRVGFLDGLGGWISSHWCNTHDEYHTRISSEDDKQFEDFKGENQVPTHYWPLPDKPKQEEGK